MKKLVYLFFAGLVSLSFSLNAFALTLFPVPKEPIYFEPPVVLASDEQRTWNCATIDNAIRYLHPYRYSYKPAFSEDEANQLAVALVTVDNLPIIDGGLFGLAYLAY
jgi:hypothetical protein